MKSSAKIIDRHETSALLAELKNKLLQDWEIRARAMVQAAKVQSQIALRDSLPEFIDQLVKTLSCPAPTLQIIKSTVVAKEHAEDRADQPEYSIDQVITEYHILRSIILESIETHGPSDIEARKITNDFMDSGIGEAVKRYIELVSKRQALQTTEIEAAKVEAERANYAKSTFLANMSHEIRTPLGAIMGFVGLLKDSGLEPNEVTNYLAIIDRNSHHLLRIIDDILDLAKVEAGKMTIEETEFSLAEFLADFSSLVGIKARENGIIFESKAMTLLPEFVISDSTRIRQILSNIVGNAIKFTEKGRVELAIQCNDNLLEFKVSDTGRGISEAQRGHLFQAFSQADSSTTRKFGGTGLGLILTKKLSEALGGSFVLVESEIGKGSIFEAKIPIKFRQQVKHVPLTSAKTISVNATEIYAADFKGLEILVVDDSPDNQYLIQKMLNKTEACISLASDGAEGVRLALEKHFDIILMDIQMPVMDGHGAVRLLRSKNYTGPIVALTAHAMKEEKERAVLSGFSHFLTKPIHRQSLLDLLSELYSSIKSSTL